MTWEMRVIPERISPSCGRQECQCHVVPVFHAPVHQVWLLLVNQGQGRRHYVISCRSQPLDSLFKSPFPLLPVGLVLLWVLRRFRAVCPDGRRDSGVPVRVRLDR